MNVIDAQARIKKWCLETFGEIVFHDHQERCLRLIEEAVELAQTTNLDKEKLHKLIDYVYSRPEGEPGQELAGTMVTLLAAASSMNVDLAVVSEREIERIETPEIQEKVRRRQLEKREITK